MKEFRLDTTMEVDLEEVKKFVENKLPAILIENIDFPEAAFCLQVLLDKIEELKGENLNDNEESEI